jgi:hypothetical protein
LRGERQWEGFNGAGSKEAEDEKKQSHNPHPPQNHPERPGRNDRDAKNASRKTIRDAKSAQKTRPAKPTGAQKTRLKAKGAAPGRRNARCIQHTNFPISNAMPMLACKQSAFVDLSPAAT